MMPVFGIHTIPPQPSEIFPLTNPLVPPTYSLAPFTSQESRNSCCLRIFLLHLQIMPIILLISSGVYGVVISDQKHTAHLHAPPLTPPCAGGGYSSQRSPQVTSDSPRLIQGKCGMTHHSNTSDRWRGLKSVTFNKCLIKTPVIARCRMSKTSLGVPVLSIPFSYTQMYTHSTNTLLQESFSTSVCQHGERTANKSREG